MLCPPVEQCLAISPAMDLQWVVSLPVPQRSGCSDDIAGSLSPPWCVGEMSKHQVVHGETHPGEALANPASHW